MKVLGIECSTARGSVAVVEAGKVLWTREFGLPRGRGGELYEAVEQALAACGGGADRIAVGIGPGSYNGLRASIALAMGLASSLAASIATAPSVCCLEDREYFFLGDARGGMWHFTHVADGKPVEGPKLISPSEAAGLTAGGLPVFAGDEGLDFRCSSAAPQAAILCRLSEPWRGEAPVPEPIYLKPPHITQPRLRP